MRLFVLLLLVAWGTVFSLMHSWALRRLDAVSRSLGFYAGLILAFMPILLLVPVGALVTTIDKNFSDYALLGLVAYMASYVGTFVVTQRLAQNSRSQNRDE